MTKNFLLEKMYILFLLKSSFFFFLPNFICLGMVTYYCLIISYHGTTYFALCMYEDFDKPILFLQNII